MLNSAVTHNDNTIKQWQVALNLAQLLSATMLHNCGFKFNFSQVNAQFVVIISHGIHSAVEPGVVQLSCRDGTYIQITMFFEEQICNSTFQTGAIFP